MSPPGPIYASTLHRRDRTWGPRRRALLARAVVWSTTGAVVAALLARFA